MGSPRVSVNISVYNGERYVAQAVDSILNQTFTDFELVIIDDGSTDGTAEILASYDDPRVHTYSQDNRGISRSRNRALSLSKGDYVAVMDADDVSLPKRLELQVGWLDAHQDVGVLGTAARMVDDLRHREWYHRPPLDDEQLRHRLIRGNPFIHSSVTLRRKVLEAVGGYNEAYPYIVDYELFVRLAEVTRLANLPEVLVTHHYRLGSVSTTRRNELPRLWLRMRTRYEAFRRFDYPFYEALYILQPILFTLIELRPKLRAYLTRGSRQ
jgi:glycosyltransferase involved in cell wall biosynthesis